MATTTFLEPGLDATQDTSFFSGTSATGSSTVAYDSTQSHDGTGSMKCITAASGNVSLAFTKDGVVLDAGGLVSAWFRFSTVTPATITNIMLALQTANTSGVMGIALNTNGTLRYCNHAATAISGTTTLVANTWYRISMSYTNVSTSTWAAKIYINGTLEINSSHTTEGNGDRTGIQCVSFGMNSSSTDSFGTPAAMTTWVDSMYADNRTDLTDCGDVRVTAKRPNANGTTNGFTTQIGSGGSGYGTGHSSQVNERPLSTTNGWSMIGAGSAITEEYTIESAATGDVDISAATIVDYIGWVYAKSLASETASIIVANSSSNISLTSANTMFTKVAGSTTYPVGNTDIGIITTTALTTVSLYEAGIVVAYIPASATTTSTSSSTSVSTSSTSSSTSTSSTSSSISTSSTSSSTSFSSSTSHSTSTSLSTSSTSSSTSVSTSSTSSSISTSSTSSSTSQTTSTSQSTSTSISTSSTSSSTSSTSSSTSISTSSTSSSTSTSLTTSTSTSTSNSTSSTSQSTSISTSSTSSSTSQSTSTSISTSSTSASTSSSTSTSTTTTALDCTVSKTNLETAGNNVDQNSYSSGVISPTANTLILAWIYSISSTSPNIPTVSGNGLTWTKIDNQLDSDGLRQITLFRSMGASPSSGALTFDFGGQTQTGATWSIVQYSNVNTSGTNGSGAIAQSAKNSSVSSATSLTVTLTSFGSTNNATAGGFGIPLNTAGQPAIGSGFTSTGQVNQSSPNQSIGSEFNSANDTTVDMSSGAASIPWVGIAVEINSSCTVAATSTSTSSSTSISTSSTSSSTSFSTSSTSSSTSLSQSTSTSSTSTSSSFSTSSTSASTSLSTSSTSSSTSFSTSSTSTSFSNSTSISTSSTSSSTSISHSTSSTSISTSSTITTTSTSSTSTSLSTTTTLLDLGFKPRITISPYIPRISIDNPQIRIKRIVGRLR